MGYLSLNAQTKSLSLASFILAFAYLISAFLGFLRDRILASQFGASRELDIYYTAFRFPDLLATLFIFGAITAAIIPVFSQYLAKSEKLAWEYANNFLNLLALVLVPVCFLAIIFAPFLIKIISPGFGTADQETATLLLRVMFVGPIILGVSNVVSGILQVFHKFLITSLTPIVYNLGIIFGAIFLVPRIGLLGLALGVVLGAFLHLIIQLPFFWRCGFRFKLIFDFKHLGFLKTLKLMIPRSFGLAVSQINLIFITSIGSTLAPGAITVFNLANNLSGTLTNLFAVSLGTAIFPALSMAFAKNNSEKFQDNFLIAIKSLVFFLLPLSVLLFIFREEVIKLIFGSGSFKIADIKLTADCLGLFCWGILAQGLSMILVKAYYATQNTKVPALISSLSVVGNILFCLFLLHNKIFLGLLDFWFGGGMVVEKLQILVLPVAFSLASILQCFGLFYFLRIGKIDFKNFRRSILITLLSSLALGGMASLVAFYFHSYNWFGRLIVGSLVGILAFIMVAWFLESAELLELVRFVKRILLKKTN